jgi:hypothetical protein
MIIPSASVTSSDDEALHGLLLSTLTALMKASKQNTTAPLQHLFRERLGDRQQRRELNRALFAITTALSRKSKKSTRDNQLKAGVYDSVQPNRKIGPKELEELLYKIDYSGDAVLLEVILESALIKVNEMCRKGQHQ